MILNGDVREQLRRLPDNSVHCVVTSPPYWGLRDYNTARWEGGDASCTHVAGPLASAKSGLCSGRGVSDDDKLRTFGVPYKGDVCGRCGARRHDAQLGLEPTVDEYVAHMVAVFREVRRVLRPEGALWLNLGDSFASGEIGRHDKGRTSDPECGPNEKWQDEPRRNGPRPADLKPKDLVGMPWRVAFALQADGWYLRMDVVWDKPNAMPESVRDRPTKSHEYVFLLTKSARYYYDKVAVLEPIADASLKRISEPTFADQTGGAKDYAVTGQNANRSARRMLEHFAAPLLARVAETVHVARKSEGPNSRIYRAYDPAHGADADGAEKAHRQHPSRQRDTAEELRAEAEKRGILLDPRNPGSGSRGRNSAGLYSPRRLRPDAESVAAATGGRNKRSVWRVATAPYRGAHFAVMPPKLVEPCVLATTSPHCCETCGAPWRRLSRTEALRDARMDAYGDNARSDEARRANKPRHAPLAYMGSRVETDGWRPTCGCVGNTGAGQARVLDPFAGSGTVALVALEHGRSAVCVELNAKYIGLLVERLGVGKEQATVGEDGMLRCAQCARRFERGNYVFVSRIIENAHTGKARTDLVCLGCRLLQLTREDVERANGVAEARLAETLAAELVVTAQVGEPLRLEPIEPEPLPPDEPPAGGDDGEAA